MTFILRDVTVRFGSVTALDGVNLEVRPGERLALVGPSGAGKSTLLSVLNGSVAPSSGTVEVLGRELAPLRPRARRSVQRGIGTIHQQFDLVGPLAVVHNVNAGHLGRWSFVRAALSLVSPRDLAGAEAALRRVGIGDKLRERTDRLSGGQQQRVALARVLVQNPVAILADEPIASLDPARGREVMDLLRDLAAESEKTLVVSLHAFEYALSHCDRVVGLRDGRVLFDASADALDPMLVERLYRIDGAPAER